MQSTTTPLELFFQTWELNMASGNVPALVASFAEVFLYASPHGTQSVKASDFALALPKAQAAFREHWQPAHGPRLLERNSSG